MSAHGSGAGPELIGPHRSRQVLSISNLDNPELLSFQVRRSEQPGRDSNPITDRHWR